jgi:hypothetical protein
MGQSYLEENRFISALPPPLQGYAGLTARSGGARPLFQTTVAAATTLTVLNLLGGLPERHQGVIPIRIS